MMLKSYSIHLLPSGWTIVIQYYRIRISIFQFLKEPPAHPKYRSQNSDRKDHISSVLAPLYCLIIKSRIVTL